MPKVRKIPSIEYGLYEAFKILKDIGIEEAIKKYRKKNTSASFYRNCANPDEVHNIDHADSIAIDFECLKTKGNAPMFAAHETMISKFLNENKTENTKDLSQVMNELNIIIGEFQTVVHKSQSPLSPGGEKITGEEKMKIKEAIVKLERILLHLQITVGES